MATQKIQRWIDLLAALLRRKFTVSLEELAAEVPDYLYARNKAALRRTFERDKDELRAFGIPIETVTGAEGDAIGYRLQPQNFYLPYLTLRSAGGSKPRKVGEEVPGRPQNRRFQVRRTDAFARWLLSFAGDIVPVSPRTLVDEYRGLVSETLAHHSTDRPSASPSDRP